MLNTNKWLALLSVVMLTGCATAKSYDYTSFKQSNPSSILVLPPLNNSPDMRATYSYLSTVTQPLAESGFYVFPVALVDQTFKENGLLNPAEMHQASLAKIREIFGADATLYITVTKYGASYTILSSEVRVTANAKLIDNRSGKLLWDGEASASDSEGNNSHNAGLAGLLVGALLKQVMGNIGDQGRAISRMASYRLLHAHPNGIPYGPRSPLYGKQ